MSNFFCSILEITEKNVLDFLFQIFKISVWTSCWIPIVGAAFSILVFCYCGNTLLT